MTSGGNSLHFWYDVQNRPAIVDFNGTKYAYILDLQGDVVGLKNASGTEVVRYTYDAWGKKLETTGELAGSLGYLNPFRYRGYVYDEETGRYYLRSRYYNPTRGRFVNCDSFEFLLTGEASLAEKNLFAYCDNNAIVRKDDAGEFWHILAGAIAGAIIGAAVQIVSNAIAGEDLLSGVGTAAVSGAASGALAAFGVGLAASVAGNAAISMANHAANQVIDNNGFDNFDVGSMLIDGVIGAASGLAGGSGMSKTVNLRTLNKNLTRKVLSGSWKTMAKGTKYYISQTKTLYKEHLVVPILKSAITATVGNSGKALMVE